MFSGCLDSYDSMTGLESSSWVSLADDRKIGNPVGVYCISNSSLVVCENGDLWGLGMGI